MNRTQRNALFERIAREVLGVPTLRRRLRKKLELYCVDPRALRAALAAAFEAGVAHGLQVAKRPIARR